MSAPWPHPGPRRVAVAAMTHDRVIGADGGMPWRVPEDMAHFKATTMGGTVVMGRRTWESFGSKPLVGRRNIVITSDPDHAAAGAEVVGSLEEAYALAAAPGDGARVPGEVFVVGGGRVYAEALPGLDTLVISWLDLQADGDTRFPEWDERVWSVRRREPRAGFAVVWYDRVAPDGPAPDSASRPDSQPQEGTDD